jgi:hypothetical protein
MAGQENPTTQQSQGTHLAGHKLGRAVFYMLKRHTLFDQDKFLATR